MPLPGKRWRTIASAQTMPNTVFSGTAIAAIFSVSQNACFASGVVTESHAGPTPCSNARQKTSPTGMSRIAARYRSTPTRRLILAIMPRRPAAERADQEQGRERDQEQDERERGRAGSVVRLETPEDVDGRHLGL